MRKKAWFTALALLLTALFLLLPGCGKKGLLDPKNPVGLVLWHYYNGPQKVAFDELVTEFNDTVGREQGIVVEALSQGNVNDLMQNVIDAAEQKVGAGEIPDIFAAYADTAYTVDQLGLVAELDQYLTEEELAAYIPAYIDEGRFDEKGSLKIFPIAKSTEVFMLNKTDWERFAAATGAELSDLSTLEGVTRTAKAYYEWTDSLTEAANDGKAFFGRDAMANYLIIGCRQLGVELFSVQNGQVTLNVDEAALRKIWDNYYVPYVSGYFTAEGRFRSDDAKTGAVIALVGSTSGAAYFPDQVMVGDDDSYPIECLALEAPCFEGAEPYAVQQGAGMVVTKSSEAREYAATVFLKWFTEAERNIEFSVGSGCLPVKTAANDEGKILAAMPADAVEGMRQSLAAAVNTTKTHALYTNKAFSGGNRARSVLEDSLQQRADADRRAVEAALKQGKSLAEAVSAYDTDENFKEWFTGFQQELTEAVHGK